MSFIDHPVYGNGNTREVWGVLEGDSIHLSPTKPSEGRVVRVEISFEEEPDSALYELKHGDWSSDTETGWQCFHCGRKLKEETHFVEVVNGGTHLHAPREGTPEESSGYMGFWPIGPECAKKFPSKFIYVSEDPS